MVFLPDDKSIATLVMNKTQYEGKLKLNKNPTTCVKMKRSELVRRIHCAGHISNNLKNQLISNHHRSTAFLKSTKRAHLSGKLSPELGTLGSCPP